MIVIVSLILLAIILIYLLIRFIKSKKYRVLITIFSIITICLSYFLYTDNKDYKVIYDGYISNFDNIIIYSVDEYNEFMSDSSKLAEAYKQKISSNKYNKNYFKNKSIALIFISTGSSMNKFNGVDLSNKNDTLIVKPNIEYAGGGIVTADINGKLLLVEIGKNITKIELQR